MEHATALPLKQINSFYNLRHLYFILFFSTLLSFYSINGLRTSAMSLTLNTLAMKYYLLILISLMTLSLGSCSHHAEHGMEQETILLNNGQKWKVDDNMMVHIQQMISDLKRSSNQESRDYEALQKNLIENINLLTGDCTMKGQAHDELHKWLLPFITLVNDLENRKGQEAQESWFVEIQDSMEVFNSYFN
jgi:hypothetical protein